jgi:hypothetical protein
VEYRSTFTVSFSARTDGEARAIAANHQELLRDVLRVEGADSPSALTLEHITDQDGRDIFAGRACKPIR